MGQRVHQPGEESDVGDRVDDGGPARQHPVLDPQVRAAVGGGEDRPVPPVDGAVVQTQFGQPGHPARLQLGLRVLRAGDRQEGREVAPVLLEQVEDRVHPPLPEPHSGAYALGDEFGTASVGALLEQRHPGLRHQVAAEQEGGVRPHHELDTGDRLGGVPVRRELLRAHLQVHLGRGAGRLRHDRLRFDGEVLGTPDVDHQVLLARLQDLVVQQQVAPALGDVGNVEMTWLQGRQGTDHHDRRAARQGGGVHPPLGPGQYLGHRLLERSQPVRPQRARLDVQLDVEPAELGGEVLVVDRLQGPGIDHRRPHPLIDQVEFDLQPGELGLGDELHLLQQAPQDGHVPAHLAAIAAAVPAIEGPDLDFCSHGLHRPARLPTLSTGAPHCGARPSLSLWSAPVPERSPARFGHLPAPARPRHRH
ncbi:hypothetical protein SDC9_103701 [bioreactor metagenome]|uniref:Uncharacterized protein n=1 Tax=bioreactor metagenome TaxID=1076179 RepID=A0A645B584_9ZZZZ